MSESEETLVERLGIPGEPMPPLPKSCYPPDAEPLDGLICAECESPVFVDTPCPFCGSRETLEA